MGKITLSNVRKSFGETHVIPGIDLTIEEGEFVAIVGRSDLVEEGVEAGHSHDGAAREETAFDHALDAFSRSMSSAVATALMPMSEVEALDRLGDGIAISPRAALKSALYTGLLLPLGFGVLAALALRRREL